MTIVDPGANAEAVFSAGRPMTRLGQGIGHTPRWRPLRNFN